MYLLIAIVFIAELIITFTVVRFLWATDKKVCKLNEQLLASRNSIMEELRKFRKNIHVLEKWVNCVINYVEKKKEEYILKFIKTILIYALIFIIEIQFSKRKNLQKIVKGGKALLKGLLA